MSSHFLAAALRHRGVPITIGIVRAGVVVGDLATKVEFATDSTTRKRGLLGRTALSRDCALVIAPSNGVHTFFMKFAIDVVFANREGRVVKIKRAVKPWRVALAFSAFAVVELASGAADRAGLAVGDHLRFLV